MASCSKSYHVIHCVQHHISNTKTIFEYNLPLSWTSSISNLETENDLLSYPPGMILSFASGPRPQSSPSSTLTFDQVSHLVSVTLDAKCSKDHGFNSSKVDVKSSCFLVTLFSVAQSWSFSPEWPGELPFRPSPKPPPWMQESPPWHVGGMNSIIVLW